jgi:hypothetical protein
MRAEVCGGPTQQELPAALSRRGPDRDKQKASRGLEAARSAAISSAPTAGSRKTAAPTAMSKGASRAAGA